MSIGDRVRELRTESRLTQASLAERLYVHRQTVQNWESGRVTPSVNDLVVLSDSFGVSLDWLVAGRGSHDGRVLIGGRS